MKIEDLQQILEIILYIVMAICMLIITVSTVSALSDAELNYCGQKNVTINDCLVLWSEVKQIIGNVTFNSTIIQYVNVTTNITVEKIVNQTVFVERSCNETVDYQKALWGHEEEILRIQNGLASCPAIDYTGYISSGDCDNKVVSELAKANTNPPITGNSYVPESIRSSDIFRDTPAYVFVIIFVILAYIVYVIYQKMSFNRSQGGYQSNPYAGYPPYDDSPPRTYSNPNVPKQQTQGGVPQSNQPEFI